MAEEKECASSVEVETMVDIKRTLIHNYFKVKTFFSYL